ncbi:sugar phosphate nucleotidyltransferase [Flavobacteriales bacterium]|nr:sugar phosphate nucleotidyltransferase [Flavobacteriales bacterium]
MKIIVPMAGIGSRLRPHTLTTPKPLLPIAGKPIVQRLVEDIAAVCEQKITDIAFIIGDFGDQVKEDLKKVAADLGAVGHVYRQEVALGTAHAIMCAKEQLDGKVVVAFADTLFRANFKLDSDRDGIIWVQKVEDPSAFGVVKLDDQGIITDFVEKPSEFVSDLAIIGIYFFKDGAYLRSELQYLLDNKIMDRGEYQITDALENMKKKGTQFAPGEVIEWMDCGKKEVTVDTNKRVLDNNKDKNWVADSVESNDAIIIPPCYIGENVKLTRSVVGPHVSIGDNTVIEDSVIKNTIIQKDAFLSHAQLVDSMVGNHAKYKGILRDVSIGDYCQES